MFERVTLRGLNGRPVNAAILVGLCAPLVALAVAGLSSRYAADDYCTAGQVQLAGFIDAQARLYVGWSGRFAATFLVTLVELIGPMAVPVLPGVALLAWLAAVNWSALKVTEAFGLRLPPLTSWLLASLVVFATLDTTADLPQILFWQTGLLTYLCPLVLATLYAGWLSRCVGHPSIAWPIALGVSFGLTFFAGGTSETFAAAQVAALTLAMLTAWIAGARPGRSRLQAILLAGLVGAGLALMIVAVSPGNEVRQEVASRSPLTIAIPQALEFTQGWLRLTFARPHTVVLGLLLGLPALIAVSNPRAPRRPIKSFVLLAGIAGVALVIFACMLPAFYALGSNPPGRAQVIPQYVLVCSLAVLSWIAGNAASRLVVQAAATPWLSWAAAAVLLLLLVLGPLDTAVRDLQQLTPARAYAMAWDQLDGQVRAERSRGARDVTVPRLPSTGNVQNLEFVGTNRHDWFNECVARYYDLSSIAADA
jgi:hypothetical protein